MRDAISLPTTTPSAGLEIYAGVSLEENLLHGGFDGGKCKERVMALEPVILRLNGSSGWMGGMRLKLVLAYFALTLRARLSSAKSACCRCTCADDIPLFC